jgi:GNAT superfamily N-acetyltransferase
VHVREIEPNEDDELQPWWAVQHASRRADWPDDPPITLTEVRAMANGGFGSKRFVLAVASEGPSGPIIGCSLLGLPTRDNTRVIEADIQVDPAHRRSGVGRALALHLEELARAEGRTTLTGGFEEHLDDPAPGRAFAAVLGYEIALSEIRRDLALPLDAARLEALEAAARSSAAGYRIVTWRGRTPGELVEGAVELERAISRDSPHGDLEHEEGEWDEDRLRASEATVADMGQLVYHAGAIAEATGRLVAVTRLGVSAEAPERANQYGTVVIGSDRGHRLGLLVKIANLRALMEHSPQTRTVCTWNGETNLHMSRVNDELGFRQRAHAIIVQKRLTAPGPPSEG